jgi:hypothetical protein
MSRTPIFKHYLRTKIAGVYNYYYLDNAGDVQLTSGQTPLQFAPKGWKEMNLAWARGFTYWAMFRTVSKELKFVKDGAKILRHIYYNGSIESKVELYIEKNGNTAANPGYDPYFYGEVDLSYFNDETDYVNGEIIEGGFISKLKARETTEYEIDVANNVDRVWVYFHGINLQFRQTWETVTNEDVNSIPSHIPTISEGTNLNISIYTEDTYGVYVNLIENTSGVSQDVTVTYDWNYFILIPAPTATGEPYQFHLFYEMHKVTNPIPVVTTYDISLGSPLLYHGQSGTFTGTNTQTITIPHNYRIIIVLKMETTTGPAGSLSDGSYSATQLAGTKLTMTLDNKVPASYVPCLRTKKVFDTIIDNISDGETVIESDLLDVEYPDLVFSCGDALRNLENSVLKTDFSKIYNAIDYQLDAMFFYDKTDGKAKLRNKVYAFDNTQIGDLGEVADLKISPFSEEMFSKLILGQNTFVYDEVNGKDEINSETIFSSPVTRCTAEKNWKSEVRFDMYGAEFIRLNLSGKEVTDADSDNDIFGFHIENSPSGAVPAGLPGAGEDFYNLYRDAVPPYIINNIYSPETAYNIFFSPKRSLLRKASLLHSLLYNLDTEYLKYTTSGKSNNLALKAVTDDGITVIDEGADVLISDLGYIFFKPVKAKVKTQGVPDLLYTMENTPFGYFAFKWKGIEYYGWPIKVSTTDAAPEAQEFELLMTPASDLTKLIV